MDSENIYDPTLWDRIGPTVYTVGVLLMNAAFIGAGLALLYLIYAMLPGSVEAFAGQPQAKQKALLDIVALCAKVLLVGLTVGTICTVYITWGDDVTGYGILGVTALIGVGIPQMFAMFGGNLDSKLARAALNALTHAALIPAAIGAILVLRDVVLRLVNGIRNKPLAQENLTYGMEAEASPIPKRTSILGKCWEGPYCREFIRTHCPIFVARKACWKEKVGCYCEEEIVSKAAARVQGVQLEMAPDPRYNFANPALPASANSYKKPQLSDWQKKERCRNCVIYNEHEREKYRLLMPVVLVGGTAACLLVSQMAHNSIGKILGFTEKVAGSIAINGVAPATAKPSDTLIWLFVAAFTVMIVSKMLHVLEWACFKAKI